MPERTSEAAGLAACSAESSGNRLAGVAEAAALPSSADSSLRLGFSVNDDGIEIPKRDSQRLLDDYIKKWTAERGIENYTVGKKEVTCELFLDLILFECTIY